MKVDSEQKNFTSLEYRNTISERRKLAIRTVGKKSESKIKNQKSKIKLT
jgi:hypothetical protein